MSGSVVWLPGWSFNGGTFRALAAELGWHPPRAEDALPGHGGGAEVAGPGLEGMVQPLMANAPDDALWVTNSLGATVALAAAEAGKPMRALVLIGATPRFTLGDGWSWGVPVEELAAMQEGLARSVAATVRRFRRRLGRVSTADARAAADPVTATPRGLEVGLQALAEGDLRYPRCTGRPRTLWIGGEQDPLVPPEAVRSGAHTWGGQVCQLPEGGHLVHATHPEMVAHWIDQFLEGSGS